MPYQQKQARAIFLDIKRRQGLEAAKQFGRKHKADLSGGRPYRPRRRRSS